MRMSGLKREACVLCRWCCVRPQETRQLSGFGHNMRPGQRMLVCHAVHSEVEANADLAFWRAFGAVHGARIRSECG
jgi:hypothetical protein